MRNGRTFGYVVCIQKGECGNSDAPFNFALVGRLLFTSDDDGPPRILVWACPGVLFELRIAVGGSAPRRKHRRRNPLRHIGRSPSRYFRVGGNISGGRMAPVGAERRPFFADDRDLDSWSMSALPTLGRSGFASGK